MGKMISREDIGLIYNFNMDNKKIICTDKDGKILEAYVAEFKFNK
jgi:hypothetical protein